MDAIVADNLGKRYRIGERQRYPSLKDALASALGRTARPARRASKKEHVWALRDVFFRIHEGEIVGVIGRNGAGKTTLLKILSRVTDPTTGEARVRGRVGSLLEVGTGFHPELTGRENVFLSGAILGMSRREIARKFDEIVSFSELEKFVDTPVKRYSSGMYVRLAFAVAAHLEPHILLVDEVLAVGDARFQRKSLDKMDDVRGEGRTIIFVSHSMPAVTRLCDRAILLDGGRVLADGPSHEITAMYLSSDAAATTERSWPAPDTAPGDGIVRLRSVRIRGEDGVVRESLDIRQGIDVEIEFDVLEAGHAPVAGFELVTDGGTSIFSSLERVDAARLARGRGRYVSVARIPGNLLAEGRILANAAILTLYPLTVHAHERDVVAFQIVDSLEGDSARGAWVGELPGVVRPVLDWKTRVQPSEEETRS
jgi:homopolymeric O-antigen transport system ATP-binding protein